MIRRLADRLVSVDLLDQAAELLQYQVDNRLQGAARAQVATRLAVIYLMNRKPDKAQAVLRATRTADLSNELRDPAAADRGARAVRHRPPRFRARGDRQHRGPRGDAAARRHLLGGAALAQGGRADRAALRRPLEELRAAHRRRARRHAARRRRLCAGRGQARPRAAARQIRGQDGARGRTAAPSMWSPAGSARTAREFREVARIVASRRHAVGLPARPARRAIRRCRACCRRRQGAPADDAPKRRSADAEPTGSIVRADARRRHRADSNSIGPSARPGSRATASRRSRSILRRICAIATRRRSSAPGCPRPGSSRPPARRISA